MRKLFLVLVSGAALFALPASAATWTKTESATLMKSENGVRVYRGAAPASALAGDAAERSHDHKISVELNCERRVGYPARRLTTHGFLGVKRYYTALGRRSFN